MKVQSFEFFRQSLGYAGILGKANRAHLLLFEKGQLAVLQVGDEFQTLSANMAKTLIGNGKTVPIEVDFPDAETAIRWAGKDKLELIRIFAEAREKSREAPTSK